MNNPDTIGNRVQQLGLVEDEQFINIWISIIMIVVVNFSIHQQQPFTNHE